MTTKQQGMWVKSWNSRSGKWVLSESTIVSLPGLSEDPCRSKMLALLPWRTIIGTTKWKARRWINKWAVTQRNLLERTGGRHILGFPGGSAEERARAAWKGNAVTQVLPKVVQAWMLPVLMVSMKTQQRCFSRQGLDRFGFPSTGLCLNLSHAWETRIPSCSCKLCVQWTLISRAISSGAFSPLFQVAFQR